MADIRYPCTLPGPLVVSNGYAVNERTRRNDLSSGPPLYVLKDNQGFVAFDVGFRYTGLQMQVFRNFYSAETVYGSKLFNIDLYVDGPDGTGKQTQTHECYFDGPYAAQQENRLWLVTVRLIAIEEIIFSQCEGQSLVAAYDGVGDYLPRAVKDVDAAVVLLEDLWQL